MTLRQMVVRLRSHWNWRRKESDLFAERLLQDARGALRMTRRDPGFGSGRTDPRARHWSDHCHPHRRERRGAPADAVPRRRPAGRAVRHQPEAGRLSRYHVIPRYLGLEGREPRVCRRSRVPRAPIRPSPSVTSEGGSLRLEGILPPKGGRSRGSPSARRQDHRTVTRTVRAGRKSARDMLQAKTARS